MPGRNGPHHDAADTPRVVAVTGACTYLGTELIKMLEADRTYARVLALDVRRPDLPADLVKVEHHPVDLTVPTVGSELAELLRGVDTVVHGAFLSFPTHAASWAHELEDVGTMHLLDACAQVGPARVVVVRSVTCMNSALLLALATLNSSIDSTDGKRSFDGPP
jgi:UDP-glucose 4-epimerase